MNKLVGKKISDSASDSTVCCVVLCCSHRDGFVLRCFGWGGEGKGRRGRREKGEDGRCEWLRRLALALALALALPLPGASLPYKHLPYLT